MTDDANKNNYFDLLRRITDELLSETEPSLLRDASIGLYNLFSEISKLEEDVDGSPDWQVTLLSSGQAISPIGAARCILDFARTSKFIKGLCSAVRTLQKRFPGEQIDILYAGCGPYATLAVLLATKFDADEIRFTLLDVHERSLDSARLIFAAIGLECYVESYIRADAAGYSHSRKPHLIVTEVMKRALEKEPQVAVTGNLVPQLRRNGIFIPEKITVDACLYEPSTEFFTVPDGIENLKALDEHSRSRLVLSRLIEVSAANLPNTNNVSYLPPVIIDLPLKIDKKCGLMLSTVVTVFNSIILEEHDSIVTIPLVLREFDPTANCKKMVFTYLLGQNPGFQYKYLAVSETAF